MHSASQVNNLSFLQINLQHSYVALLELYKNIEIIKPDVILVQEPYVNKNLKVSSVPPNYRCFSKFDPSKKFYSAAIFVKNTLKADLHYDVSTNECVVVSIYINKKTLTVVSAYCPPSYKNPSLCLSPIETLGNRSTLILGGDFNARSPIWLSSNITDGRGAEMELFFACLPLVVVNDPSVATYTRFNTTSPDITAVGNRLSRDIYDWKVLTCPSLSDHGYISFKLWCTTQDSSFINLTDPRFNYKKANWNVFSKHILDNIDDIFAMPLENKQEIDNCVESLTNIIQIGINIAIPEKKISFSISIQDGGPQN